MQVPSIKIMYNNSILHVSIEFVTSFYSLIILFYKYMVANSRDNIYERSHLYKIYWLFAHQSLHSIL